MEKLTLISRQAFLDESITAIEQGDILGDIEILRKKLSEEILKQAGPGMRERTASEIIRRFISYDRKTGKIQKTPLSNFIVSKLSREAKIDVMYYYFVKTYPILRISFNKLRELNKCEFSKSDFLRIIINLIERRINENTREFRNILYSLQEFKLITKTPKNKYIINQKNLSKPAFIFILYIHFLSQNSVAPKTKEIKEFFKEIYNQPEDYTEHCLLNFGEGFWVVERIAHLDQILFVHNNIDDFTNKFFEKFGK